MNEKNKVKMSLFGGFSLSNGEAVLDEKQIHSKRMVGLMAYLIINHRAPVSSRRLSEQLWGGRSKNPENALKNLVYRVRGLMKGLGPGEYICTLQGAYQWNPAIPVETDYEQFEQMDQYLSEEQDPEKQKEICAKIIGRYQRNVTAVLADEAWLEPWLLRFRSIYTGALKMLGAIYAKEENWGSLERMCQEAMLQGPLNEELQDYLVLSLKKQKKYDQVLLQFRNTKKPVHGNSGGRTPDKVQRTFADIADRAEERAAGIDTPARETEETERPPGPPFVDFRIFCQVYQADTRQIGRLGISEYLLLLTVQHSGRLRDENMPDPTLQESVAILEKILRDMLRAGTVITLSGPTQFAVLLPAVSYEAVLEELQQIEKAFARKAGARRVELCLASGGGIRSPENGYCSLSCGS